MTQAIVIHTGFSDSADFIEGFKAHVDEENIVLPAADLVEQGDWVQFHICLVDQNPIFEGVGRCIGSVDNGEERPIEQRFDLVLDSLQFEGASQVIYEQIMDARQITSLPSDEPISLDESAQDEFLALDDAMDIDVQSDVPPEPVGYLSRPPVGGSWHPDAPAETVSGPPPSGLFSYDGGVAFPEHPPRPEPGTYRDVYPAPAPEPAHIEAQSASDATHDADLPTKHDDAEIAIEDADSELGVEEFE